VLSIQHWAAIAASSGCFAVAHAVVQGQAAGLLTFLPGLVMGWLFVRTGTLLAPILFHGLANVVWQLAVGR
jgi:membrane protease YdiL (CAAX protease family)